MIKADVFNLNIQYYFSLVPPNNNDLVLHLDWQGSSSFSSTKSGTFGRFILDYVKT